jgi:hypothetical protein
MMSHHLVLQQGNVVLRLERAVNPLVLATDLRDLLDKQPTPLAVIIDFTHVGEISQTLKAQVFRMLQHPKAARTVGLFGLTSELLQDLRDMLTGLAQTRKIVVRDTEFDVLVAMNLATVPQEARQRSGMLSYVKRA